MNSNIQKFLRRIRNTLKFRIFLLSKLPAAFFSGLRINEVDEHKCSVSVPFKWLTQNPFRSTYFASLAMAAEMSTGVLAMMHVYKREPAVSMLITNMQANYMKKATGRTVFICEEGDNIRSIVDKVVSTDRQGQITVKSTGKNFQGEVIADFYFTWSFKMKQR